MSSLQQLPLEIKYIIVVESLLGVKLFSIMLRPACSFKLFAIYITRRLTEKQTHTDIITQNVPTKSITNV